MKFFLMAFTALLFMISFIACPAAVVDPANQDSYLDSLDWSNNASGAPTTRTGTLPSSGSNGSSIRFGSLSKTGTVPNISTNAVGDATTTYNVFAGDIIDITIVADGSQAANIAYFQISGASKYFEFNFGSQLSTFTLRIGMPKNSGSGQISLKISMKGNLGDNSNIVTIVVNVVAQGATAPTTTYLQSIDDLGKIVAVGEKAVGGSSVFDVIKFNSNFTIESEATAAPLLMGSYDNGYAKNVAIDLSGNVWVVGDGGTEPPYGYFVKYDRNLVKQFDGSFEGGYLSFESVAINLDSEIWILGSDDSSGAVQVLINKYDGDGNPVFSTLYSNPAGAIDVYPEEILLSSSNIYVLGRVYDLMSNYTAYIAKFNQLDGSKVMEATFATSTPGILIHQLQDAVLEPGTENIYFIGSYYDSTSGEDVWTGIIDPLSLTVVAEATFDYGGLNDAGYGIDLSGSNLYICGSHNNDGWFIKRMDLALNTLNDATFPQLEDPNDTAYQIKVGLQGNVFVVGDFSHLATGNYGQRYMKLNSTLSTVFLDATVAPILGYESLGALDIFN